MWIQDQGMEINYFLIKALSGHSLTFSLSPKYVSAFFQMLLQRKPFIRSSINVLIKRKLFLTRIIANIICLFHFKYTLEYIRIEMEIVITLEVGVIENIFTYESVIIHTRLNLTRENIFLSSSYVGSMNDQKKKYLTLTREAGK